MKVLTLNIWNYEGPWETRRSLIRQWIDLLQPDLVGLQEVLLGDSYDQAAELFEGFEYERAYAGPMRYWNDPELGFGNLIASRWPIADCETVLLPMAGHEDQRVLLSASIDAPFGEVCFNTTHLSAQPHHGYVRELQVQAIAEVILRRRPREGFPPILCGDFNATPDSTEMRFATGRHAFDGKSLFMNDAWALTHPDEPGYTFCRKNAFRRDGTYDARLDYILFGRPLERAGRLRHCEMACHLPFDDVFPSDHFGLYAEFET